MSENENNLDKSTKNQSKSSAKSTPNNPKPNEVNNQSNPNNSIEKEVKVQGSDNVFIPLSKELENKQGEGINVNLTINVAGDDKKKKSTSASKPKTKKSPPKSTTTQKKEEVDIKDNKKKKSSWIWLLLLLLIFAVLAYIFIPGIRPDDSHIHTFGETYISDETDHWHKCTECNSIVDKTPHTFDNACDTTCNVCDYTRTITHDYDTTYQSNATEHWQVCSVCSHETAHEEHVFGGECDTTCNVCGITRTTSVLHNFAEEWTFDNTHHYHLCSGCGEKDEEIAHTLVEGVCGTCTYDREDLEYAYDSTTETYTVAGIGHFKGTDIVIPDTYDNGEDGLHDVTAIGDSAFYTSYTGSEESNITSVTMSNNITIIGQVAFYNCKNLTSITLSTNLEMIDEFAFAFCEGLESITLPSSLKTIEMGAFGYAGITSLDLPEEVENIGQIAFVCCTKLETITVNEGNTTYQAVGNCLVETANKTIIVGTKTSIIPTSKDIVTTIGQYSFGGVELTSIVIPNNIELLYKSAFMECPNLETIFYGGEDATAWNSILSGTGENCDNFNNAQVYYYSENVPQVASETSTHWHYNDETKPTLWLHTAHEYDFVCDDTCNVCGYIREVTHTWDTTTYHYDSTEHWYECSVCGTEGTHTAHTYTDINDVACICGYIRDITKAYYTTKYYVENLAGTGYDFVEETTDNIGTIGETANATIKTYTHFIHDTTNTNKVESGEVTADGNLVLKVYYTRRECNLVIMKDAGIESVSASGNGVRLDTGSESSHTLYKVKYGATVTLSGTASAGYSVGFTKGPEALSGNTYTQDSLEVTITANAIANSYSLAYNTNGGNTITAVDKIYNTAFTSAELPTPTKTGYDFDGWYNNNSDSATKVEANDLFTNSTATFANISTANTIATIYAKWTPKTNTEYTVEYYLQNIENDEYTKDDTKTETKTGTTATTATVTAGAITGFTYDEDNDDNVTSGTITSDGSLVLKLYYNRRNGNIIIEKGTGISTVSATGTGVNRNSETIYSVKYGATVTLSATASDGYTFSGWTRGSGSSATTITGNTIIQDTASEIYLTANATEATYAVTFSGNATDSTISISSTSMNVTYNGPIETLPTATRSHYEFGGWFKEETCTNEITTTIELNSTNFVLDHTNKTTTVYAKWIACEYGDNWTYDSTNHWKVCIHDGCSDINNTATHTFDNACDTTCNVCEYTRTITHNYSYDFNDAGHYQVCSVCNHTTTSAEHTYGTNGLCTICGRTQLAMEYYESSSTSSYYYKVKGMGVYTGTTPTIPATYNDGTNGLKDVYQIESNAFKNNKTITSVVFSSKGTGKTYDIGANVFNGCTNLASVTLNSVYSIGGSAFSGCTSLTSVTFPTTLFRLNEHCFYGCTGITSIHLPRSIYTIKENPFAFCSNVESITVDTNNASFENVNNCVIKKSNNTLVFGCKNSTIPNNVTIIAADAFWGHGSLTSVTLPSTLTTIQGRAFSYTSISSITIPASVTTIENHVFSGTALTSVTIPATVTTLGAGAFMSCEQLTSVTFEEPEETSSGTTQAHLTTLKYNMFMDSTNLTSANIPSTITTIEAYIFYDTKITSLHIPASVTSILASSFENCGYLETITVASDNTKYMSQDNCLIDKTTNTLVRGCKNSIIPTNKITGTDNYLVTKIGARAFSKTQATGCISIPSNITEIGGKAFEYSTYTSIILSENITTVGWGVFNDSSLATIYYLGTADDWATMVASDDYDSEHNGKLTTATKYYYSANEPTTAGNYWRYVDGEVTVWTASTSSEDE